MMDGNRASQALLEMTLLLQEEIPPVAAMATFPRSARYSNGAIS
ncbi:hypothetical protein ACO0LO_07500 [Undibacterium sp. TJN25]